MRADKITNRQAAEYCQAIELGENTIDKLATYFYVSNTTAAWVGRMLAEGGHVEIITDGVNAAKRGQLLTYHLTESGKELASLAPQRPRDTSFSIKNDFCNDPAYRHWLNSLKRKARQGATL